VTQPLYAGGRIDAGRRATAAMLEAAGQDLEAHRQLMASAVAEAYFGSQVAEQGVNYAEEQLAHARETEAFVKARAKEGAVLEADALRATAYRAQASAELEIARQRVGSARSALALLVNDEAAAAALSTTLDVPSTSASTEPPAGQAATPRADLLAARARARAADDGAVAARGSLLPEVFAQLAVDTALRKPDEGRIWTTAFVGARWQLSFGAQDEAMAALARARGAAYAARWQERQAGREVAEARRAFEAAVPQIAAAQEAIAAGEAVRTQRRARHQQGLLPLTEVLDAEAGLAGARTLLLRAQLESRLALVHLQLALGQPVEGVTP
jgi:outer membrane protein TolC